MPATLSDLFLNPGQFFAQKMQEEEGLKLPALIVLIAGIIGAVGAVIGLGPVIQLLPAEASSFTPVLMAIGAGGALITVFVVWVVWTVIFYVLSMIFKGTGSFKRLLEFVGYGFIPEVIGGLITLPILFLYFSTLDVPQVSDPTQIQEITLQLMSAPELQIAGVISLLFLIWSANIWIFGLKEARSLSTRNAVITVGVPVGFYVAFQLYGLFFSGGF
jgi:hypothetical protein